MKRMTGTWKFLEKDETIGPDDYMRCTYPQELMTMSKDESVIWGPVSERMPYWIGKTLGDYAEMQIGDEIFFGENEVLEVLEHIEVITKID